MSGYDYIKQFDSVKDLGDWLEKHNDVKDYRVRTNPTKNEITLFYNK